MTTLGIALIVSGLTLVCGSMIFRMFSEPSSTGESFEESLERIDDKMRRAQAEDRSAPTEHVPNDSKRRDE
jgi:predicted phage gp36 major capsid-like protein